MGRCDICKGMMPIDAGIDIINKQYCSVTCIKKDFTLMPKKSKFKELRCFVCDKSLNSKIEIGKQELFIVCNNCHGELYD